MKRVLYVYPNLTSFIRKDKEILELKFDVRSFEFAPRKKFMTPWIMLRQFFFLLLEMPKSALVVVQFAGYHAVLPVILSKVFGQRVLIIVAGTDAAGFPTVNYGNFVKFPLSVATRVALKNCDYIAPVHESLVYAEYRYDKSLASHQGYQYWIPGINTPHREINYAYDESKFYCKHTNRRPFTFITVANVQFHFALVRKGLDLMFDWARAHPNYTFTLVGVPEGWTPPEPVPNLRLVSFVGEKELLELYNDHQFYVQLSIMEGFPNALTEAMMCGCIPVVSDVAAMPFIANDFGAVVPHRSIESLDDTFKALMEKGIPSHDLVASETAKRFPLRRRREQLLGLADELIKT